MKNTAYHSLLAAGLLAASTASGAIQVFTYTGGAQSFTVPNGVTSVDVLGIGGGGGASGHQGGGGYISYGSFSVTPGDVFSIAIGAGGSGADQREDKKQIPISQIPISLHEL